jgi:hypothetical protein
MTIINKNHTDRTFYDVTDENSIQYTVIKSSINGAATEWMAVKYGPYENITSTELGQSLIAYCQANP